ncbi:MAG TPA: Hsp20/alpha crystallin family protein [Gemmatimonadaceae bacterium]|nr:Hsp20/alpha crystallin family protein [Gemmatimonadaceae bacterium]
MATRNESTTSTRRDQSQQAQQAQPAQQQGAAAGAGTRSRATGGATAQSGRGQAAGADTGAGEVSRPDQERQRPVSRETGMQAGARGQGMTRRTSPALSTFATASPALLASAFMANPYEFMRRMNAEMDRLFDEAGFGGAALEPARAAAAGRGLAGGTAMAESGVWTPQIETFRRGNDLVLRADLPGVRKEDIHVEIQDDMLTLSGERRQEHEERHEGMYRSERSYGTFFRAVPLPEGVDEDRISATCENGVLEVTVPLPEQKAQRGRKIDVR